MKYLFAITVLSVFLLIPGCYTVVWSPGMEFPDEEDFEQETAGTVYYEDNYYNSYDMYYNTPWWLTIIPPASAVAPSRAGESGSSTGYKTRSNPRGGNSGSVSTPRPSRSINSSSGTTAGNRSEGSSNSKTKTRSRNSSSKEKPLRSNDGGRSSDRK